VRDNVGNNDVFGVDESEGEERGKGLKRGERCK
jgi:hypothetical protein